MRAGATICETNTVRKHLSEILGGQFAELAYPATLAALIFSDVPGNELDMISSGPTVMDTTTVDDAATVLAKYNIIKICNLNECGLRETPKDPKFFKNVYNCLIVSNVVATEAMMRSAVGLGYKTKNLGTVLGGEARSLGVNLAQSARPGLAIIGAGETIVKIDPNAVVGKGGRNQELALGALPCVSDNVLVVACASDGIDNGTPAAGALADAAALSSSAALGLAPEIYLANHDSFTFFKKIKDQIVTGTTGSNVSDLFLALGAKKK